MPLDHAARPAVRTHGRWGARLLLAATLCAAPVVAPTGALADPAHAGSVASMTPPPGTPDLSFAPDAAAFTAPPAARLAQPVVVPLSRGYLAANGAAESARDKRPSIDSGQRTFGVEPSGPTKPDARPNLTYQNVQPGQRLFDRVAILNISNEPVTLTFYAADGYNTVDGAFDVLKPPQRSKDLGSWVKLRRTSAKIPGRSALITPIELNIPRNVEPGDHAAAVIASLHSQVHDAKGNLINRDDRTGTRLYVRVTGKLRPKVDLDCKQASYDNGAPLRGKTNVTYIVKNTGNVRLLGKQTIRITNLLGMATNAIDTPDLPELLPGNQFEFTRPVNDVVPTFFNTARVVIDPQSELGNVDPALEQAVGATQFFAMSWPGALLLALLVGTGVHFWWRRRRRRPAAVSEQWGDGAPGGTDEKASPGDAAPTEPGEDVEVTTRFADEPMAKGPARPATARAGRRGIRLALLAVLGATGAAPLLVAGLAGPAHADSGGTLTFLPGKGIAAVPLYAITSGPCPAKATNVTGKIFGKGFKPEGKTIIPTEDGPVRHDGAFGVGFQDSMVNFAREEGVKELHGDYRVSLRCIDQFDLTSYAEFTGTITYPDPGHFTAPTPAKPPVSGVPDGILAEVFPRYQRMIQGEGRLRAQELRQEATATPTPTPAPGGSHDPVTVAEALRAKTAEQEAASTSSTSHLLGPVGIAAAVLLALAATGYVVTRRPRSNRPARS